MTVVRYRAQADYHLVSIAPLDAAPIRDPQLPTTLLQVTDDGVSQAFLKSEGATVTGPRSAIW